MNATPLAPAGAYAVVERLHLRQWAMRCVLPLAALASNGSGPFEVSWLPRHDAPGFAPDAELGIRIAGGVLVALSALLRVAAKGVLVRKTTLTTCGAYGVVRHPFYFANLTGAIGTFLLAGSLGAVVAAAWLALAAPIYAATVTGEERALRHLFPAEFAEYSSRVRAMLPGLPPRDAPAGKITWANLVAEREPPRLLRFLAGAVAVLGLTLPAPASNAVLALAGLAFGASYGLR
jgi:protein-S-isoprenylcysteine O-methyltransferase Ste14